MATREKHAPGYDTLTEDERVIADDPTGDLTCQERNAEGYLCTRPREHAGRHTAFGSRFLGAWETHVAKRGSR